MKKAVFRSIILVLIIGISVGLGFLIDNICHAIDKSSHPIEYSEYVEKYSKEYGVPENVIYAVILCESKFESNAVSSQNAIGLMQMIPSTFLWLCEKTGDNFSEGMLYDPETNIRFGTYYLSYLYEEFGLWETVYAAYNCGPGKVKEWQENPEYADKNGVLIDIPYPETKNYVKKVSKAAEKYNELYFEGDN